MGNLTTSLTEPSRHARLDGVYTPRCGTGSRLTSRDRLVVSINRPCQAGSLVWIGEWGSIAGIIRCGRAVVPSATLETLCDKMKTLTPKVCPAGVLDRSASRQIVQLDMIAVIFPGLD